MERLNNDKFQKLEEFKIENLDLVRGGRWTSRTRRLDETEWSDSVLMGYCMADGHEVGFPTSKYDVLSSGTL